MREALNEWRRRGIEVFRQLVGEEQVYMEYSSSLSMIFTSCLGWINENIM